MKIFSQPTPPPPTTDQSEQVPADLVRHGFRLVVRRQRGAVIWRAKDHYPVALQSLDMPRYLLISPSRGCAVGVSLQEAIEAARDVARMCEYVDRKRAEEVGL